MINFIFGLIFGLILGMNMEFLRNIAVTAYFRKGDYVKKKNKVNFLAMWEIRFKLFLCRLYEEKKIHLIILFYSLIIAVIVVLLGYVEFNTGNSYNYFDKMQFLLDRF
ncbi:MAG: hypothetical protein WC002_07385 [Candidatus Muiribacteriota bacterium]